MIGYAKKGFTIYLEKMVFVGDPWRLLIYRGATRLAGVYVFGREPGEYAPEKISRVCGKISTENCDFAGVPADLVREVAAAEFREAFGINFAGPWEEVPGDPEIRALRDPWGNLAPVKEAAKSLLDGGEWEEHLLDTLLEEGEGAWFTTEDLRRIVRADEGDDPRGYRDLRRSLRGKVAARAAFLGI